MAEPSPTSAAAEGSRLESRPRYSWPPPRGIPRVTVRSPAGAGAGAGGGTATAEVEVRSDGRPLGVHIRVACGEVLDAVVLRSYCIGAAHMALSWVCSEGIAVDERGVPQDLTIRSFGVLRAVDTPPIEVVIDPAEGPVTGPAVNGSDAVFAAVAAAAWIAQGLPTGWPTSRGAWGSGGA